MGYKNKLEQALLKENWKIKTINSSGEWWDDEHWKLEYIYDANQSFLLSFIVDPMFEGQRKKGQAIYEVKASTELPKCWNDDEYTITSICMRKQNFEKKLNEFIAEIIEFKKENLQPTKETK